MLTSELWIPVKYENMFHYCIHLKRFFWISFHQERSKLKIWNPRMYKYRDNCRKVCEKSCQFQSTNHHVDDTGGEWESTSRGIEGKNCLYHLCSFSDYVIVDGVLIYMAGDACIAGATYHVDESCLVSLLPWFISP